MPERCRDVAGPARAPILAILCGAWLLPVALATAAGQEGLATQAIISGTVVETDGTPVPGVSVSIEGPLPDLARRATTADTNGRFEFRDVIPGTYNLAIELPGLSAPGDILVTVAAGELVSTVAELSLFALDAHVSVVAKAEIDPDVFEPESTAGLHTLSNRALQQLPLPAEQALDALPVLPGVVRGPSGLISIGGTLPSDSIFLFNGIDVMDPFSGQYRLRLPLEAVDNVQLYSGVYSAAYGQILGGIVDVTTAPGGEEWRWEVGGIVPRATLRDGSVIIRRASPRVRVSGPLVPGKLYLSQSFQYDFDRERQKDVPGDGDQEDVLLEGWESLTQLDWNVSSRQSVRLTLLGFPQRDEFVGLDGLTRPEATLDFERDAEGILLKHQFRLDDRSFLDTSLQYNRVGLRSSPRTNAAFRVTPEGFGGGAFHREDRQTKHWEVKASYTRALGADRRSLLLLAGGEAHGLSLDGSYDEGTIDVLGADGSLLRRIEFFGGERTDGRKREWALFAQNRWRPADRFWIDSGLRFSGDSITSQTRLEPRVGAAFDALGDGTTLLKSSIGLLHRRLFLAELFWDQLPGRRETFFDANGPVAVVSLPTRLNDNIKAPRALLATFEINRRLTPKIFARARYSVRETRDQLVVERVEGTSLPPAVGRPVATSEGALLLTDRGRSSSRQFELTGNFRFGDESQLFLSYVRSSAVGDLNDFSIVAGETPDAIVRPNQRGRLRFDTPNRLVLWGTVSLPWDLVVSPSIEWRDGFPYSVIAEDQSYLGAANTERFPDFLNVSAAFMKGFRLFGRQFGMGAQVSNMIGRSNPRNVIGNVASDRFGELRNSEPLRFRVRFSATF